MNTINLFGVIPGSTAAIRRIKTTAKILRGEPRIISNLELDQKLIKNLYEILDLAKLKISEIVKQPPNDNLGIELHFHPEIHIKKLEDQSFGLPIYILILSEVLDIPLDEKISGTGEINDQGQLIHPDKVGAKSKLAKSSGSQLFIYPLPDEENAFGLGTTSLTHATFAWLGMAYLEKFFAYNQDSQLLAKCLLDFLNAQCNAFHPQHLGAQVYNLCKKYPLTLSIWEHYKSQWTLTCLEPFPSLRSKSYLSTLQLLRPDRPIHEILDDPNECLKFSLGVLEVLNTCAEANSIKAVYALRYFLELISTEIEIKQILNDSPSMISAISKIQQTIIDHHNRRGFSQQEQVKIQEAFESMKRYLNNLRAIEFVIDPKHKEESNKVDLSIKVIYDETSFRGFEFSVPGDQEMAPSRVFDPVALYDVSANLYPPLQRSDWDISMSLMDKIPYFQNTFGRNNLFDFPALNQSSRPTSIKWGDGTGTWPPSIDTLHLISVMKQSGFYESGKTYDRICDIGCGTGIHGILLAKNCNVQHLDLVDIEPGSSLTAWNNVNLNFTNSLQSVENDLEQFIAGENCIFDQCSIQFLKKMGQDIEVDKPYDLLICSPPYVPYMDILQDPLMWQAVAGTEFLNFVLNNAKRLAKQTIIQFSEIAMDEVEYDLGQAQLLGSNIVSFRIPPLLKYFNPADERAYKIGRSWLEKVKPYFINSETSQDHFVKNNHHGFKYFHKINTYLIE